MFLLIFYLFISNVIGLQLHSPKFNKFISNLKQKGSKIKLGEYLIERLVYEDVHTVFGYNGGAVLPLFDQIENQNKLKIYINRHEQYSGHCAESYAMKTNKLGVFITTSGPGLTNAITPLQDAYSDGIPILCISGQVSSKTLGTDAFQECKASSITSPCVKKSYLIKNADCFIEKLEEVIHIAKTPRKGPVHLDICKDMFTEYISLESDFKLTEYNLEDKINFDELYSYKCNILKNKIIHSNKPLIILGAGAKKCYEKVRKLISMYQIPAVTTFHGLGTVDELHPLALGMIGMHGSYASNKAIVEADLIIGLGNRFDDRTIGNLYTYGANAKDNFGIIHIDNSQKQINKVIQLLKPELSILADSDNLVEFLLNNYNIQIENKKSWISKLSNYKEFYKPKFENLSSNYIIKLLSDHLKDRNDYTISTGVGSHQMVFAQYFTHRFPDKILSSGSLGTMGVGLPFAIGAQIVNPDELSILIDGDGSFSMSLNELATIIEYKLPIKIFIMNDRKLGMVDMWQDIFYEKKKIGSEFRYTPEFEKIGESYGIKSFLCDSEFNINNTILNALNYDGPVLVNFMIDQSKSIPFVPNNVTLDNMILD